MLVFDSPIQIDSILHSMATIWVAQTSQLDREETAE
jgi:hypothetical protein